MERRRGWQAVPESQSVEVTTCVRRTMEESRRMYRGSETIVWEQVNSCAPTCDTRSPYACQAERSFDDILRHRWQETSNDGSTCIWWQRENPYDVCLPQDQSQRIQTYHNRADSDPLGHGEESRKASLILRRIEESIQRTWMLMNCWM